MMKKTLFRSSILRCIPLANSPRMRMLALFSMLFTGLHAQDFSPAGYVNPFIGTGGHGHTYPGPSLPFGMIQPGPDTRLSGWDGCSAYHYSDSMIYGFSHTHLSGTGCSDYGDILVQAFNGEVKWINEEYKSLASGEKAGAAYYSVLLDKHQIQAELSATLRTGIHRYHFTQAGAGILVDLLHRDEVLDAYLEVSSSTEIRGMRRSKAWAENQVIYFSMKFSKPMESFTLALDDTPVQGMKSLSGKNVKAAFFFNTLAGEQLMLKIGISAVSMDGARANLEAEQAGWDFEKVKQDGIAAWNKELSKIQVEGGTADEMAIFYTALYHSMLAPNLYMDVDGKYLGRDKQVHQAEGFDYYTVFSLWDTYRAAHPLLALIDSKRTNDFIQTFIKQYEQGGLLPVWELSANETYCMIGYHAVPVIADAYMKGIRDYDVQKAYEAMKHSSNTDLYGLPLYRKHGYIPGDQEHESVSKTLEYAYDDWCIAQIANQLKHIDEYRIYTRRAQSWKNLFDPSTWFMRPRINGGWLVPFDPREVNNHFTEANSWQYSFYVPQDIDGLMKAMGGKQNFCTRLDELFSTSAETTGRDQADITGLIGQYAHGNEPSHHMAYLYTYAGQAYKTQAMVNRIMREMYSNAPDGLSGNEDCGQMSAWYVFSALGFYPVCPGSLQYAIGSPLFKKASIHLENGNTFVIEANDRSQEKPYIRAARWNGKSYNRSVLNHQSILKGGSLSFDMSQHPNIIWSIAQHDSPRTFIGNELVVAVPSINAGNQTFTDSLAISLNSSDPEARVYYTLDGSQPDTLSKLFTGDFYLHGSTVVNALAYNPRLGSSQHFSQPTQARFIKVPAGRKVHLNTAYQNQYTAGGPNGLINSIRGTTNWRLGNWQGYLNTDFDAVVDLGKEQKVSSVSAGFLQDVKSWIWFPREVRFYYSNDGKAFIEAGMLKDLAPDNDYTVQTKELTMKIDKKVRYIRVKASPYGIIPAWHLGAGEPSHLFVDEIVIE